MKLKCKPGDLAVIVDAGYDTQHLIGKFITVVRLSTDHKFSWETSPQIMFGGQIVECEDDCLRPIRDSDGQDETLTWAPKKVTA